LGICVDELAEIVQVVAAAAADQKHDVPIKVLIAMNGNVSESDRFCHALAGCGTDDLKDLEDLEVFRHRGGWASVSVCNQIGCQIDGTLDGPLKIQRR
jgi:hypothetical protein